MDRHTFRTLCIKGLIIGVTKKRFSPDMEIPLALKKYAGVFLALEKDFFKEQAQTLISPLSLILLCNHTSQSNKTPTFHCNTLKYSLNHL